MLIALFASLGFLASWIGLVVLFVYLLVVGALFEDDWLLRGFLFLAIPFCLALGIGVMDVPSWTQGAWMVGIYFVIGVVWSFFKWLIVVTDLKKKIEQLITSKEYFDNNVLGAGNKRVPWNELEKKIKGQYIEMHLVGTYRDSKAYTPFLDSHDVRELKLTPNVSSVQAKARLFSWIMYWPFSALNYVFNRLLKDIVDFVIEQLKDMYNSMAKHLMKGLEV